MTPNISARLKDGTIITGLFYDMREHIEEFTLVHKDTSIVAYPETGIFVYNGQQYSTSPGEIVYFRRITSVMNSDGEEVDHVVQHHIELPGVSLVVEE